MSERHSIVSMIPAETFRWERKPRRFEWLRVALVGASHRRALDRASGLAFDSAFAAVPSLVVLVDLLRAFGLYANIRLQVLEPWLLGELAEHNQSLGQAFTTLLDVVENANLRALGLTGAPILVYGAYMLMAATEGALNDIFGASRDRSFLRRLRDYLLITVVVMGAALGAGVLAGVVGYANLGGFVVFGAWLLGAVALALIYRYVPNVHVPWPACWVGSIVASVIGFSAFLLELELLGAARYQALYAGLAALPLFLLWLFVSWLAFWIGAEVAALMLDWRTYIYRIREEEAGPVTMALVAARVIDALARAELDNETSALGRIASELELPLPLVDAALDPLRRAGIVVDVGTVDRPAARLRRGARETSVQQVLRALGRDASGKEPQSLADARGQLDAGGAPFWYRPTA